ncbi:hypothetical protein OHU34_38490 [Streptomyces sp. NBC_00080]|uniref:hypothetical protein n=1 Tax=Streptomyces sp. NBC_00080 TaxID=2975645 RepID=UPI0032516621
MSVAEAAARSEAGKRRWTASTRTAASADLPDPAWPRAHGGTAGTVLRLEHSGPRRPVDAIVLE